MRFEGLGHIGLAVGNELTELSDLANLLEGADFILLVAIHGHTGGVISTVFQSGQTWRSAVSEIQQNC